MPTGHFGWHLLSGLAFQCGWAAMMSFEAALQLQPQTIHDVFRSHPPQMLLTIAHHSTRDVRNSNQLVLGCRWVTAGLVVGGCTSKLLFGRVPIQASLRNQCLFYACRILCLLIGVMVFCTINSWAGWCTLLRVVTTVAVALSWMIYNWRVLDSLQMDAGFELVDPHNRAHITMIAACFVCVVVLFASSQ